MDKKRGYGKKGQVLGMPFQMIFSIMLIAIFLVVVFFVIRNFVTMQQCSQIGLFQRDLQDKIDSIWNAQEAEQTFQGSLPTNLKYVCFINFTRGKSLSGLSAEQRDIASRIYNEVEEYYSDRKANLFLYPTRQACKLPYTFLSHLDAGSVPNPFCIENKGTVSIKLYKGFDDVYVRVRK